MAKPWKGLGPGIATRHSDLNPQRSARAMRREAVRSSAIQAIGYDLQNRILEIEFINGRVYRYFDVPEFLYRGFKVARSKGEYFNTRIDARFRNEEVD